MTRESIFYGLGQNLKGDMYVVDLVFVSMCEQIQRNSSTPIQLAQNFNIGEGISNAQINGFVVHTIQPTSPG